MNKIASILLLCVTHSFLIAQQSSIPVQRAVVNLLPHQLNQAELWLPDGSKVHKASALADIPPMTDGPFIAWSIVWKAHSQGPENQLFIQFSNGVQKPAPVKIELEPHAEHKDGRFTSQLYFTEKHFTRFRLQFSGKVKMEDVAIHFFSPGNSEPVSPEFHNEILPRSACECPQPAYLNRAQWCPAGNCPPNPNPSQTSVTHLIVHHSAGTNISSDWAAVVRSIWDFHVNVNLWSDIGYNWLVDPNGVMYEGRGDNILGAHFCGKNGGTMGVCVMGDFTSVTPEQDAVNKLTELLSWKSCDAGADPLGSAFHPSSGLTLNNISGHRDGCTTGCPGDSFYPTLPAVRLAVKNRIENVCGGNVLEPPTQLAVSAVSANNIGLVWQDNSTSETGYVLERSVGSNASFGQIAALPANTAVYADATVAPNTIYYYRVKAVQPGLSSDYSNEAIAFSGTSAAGNSLNENTVSIFPNPAGEHVFIKIENQWSGKMQVMLTDANGHRAMEDFFVEKSGNKLEINLGLEKLPAGVYQILLRQGEAAAAFKLIRK